MTAASHDVILRRFDAPDDVRVMAKGRFELVHIGGCIPPITHDSWVVGTEPDVSLHFVGADHYAR
jgi:hypothetical protein